MVLVKLDFGTGFGHMRFCQTSFWNGFRSKGCWSNFILEGGVVQSSFCNGFGSTFILEGVLVKLDFGRGSNKENIGTNISNKENKEQTEQQKTIHEM